MRQIGAHGITQEADDLTVDLSHEEAVPGSG
jgi:hypothetical protein